MNFDPGIICFTHCSPSVYCRKLPDTCPVCGQKLVNTVLPIRVPFPFVRAKQHPCSILIKPSTGNFLKYYSVNNNDLHIGATSSRGFVVEYDINGICDSKTDSWNECLVVYELKIEAWYRHWDSVLLKTADKFRSSSLGYEENTLNCYSFVLEFLQNLELRDLKTSVATKEIFCENLVVAPLKEACKYISLFRDTGNNNVFIK